MGSYNSGWFALGYLLCTVKGEGGRVIGGVASSLQEGPAEEWRASLDHFTGCRYKLTGLVDTRLQTGKSQELGRRREAADITDFSNDDSAKGITNAWDGQDWRIDFVHGDLDFCVVLGNLLGEQV